MQFNAIARGPQALTDLPNISFVLAERLGDVGITTPDRLKELGAEAAWERLRIAGRPVDAHVLLALEGAINGTAWQMIEHPRRLQLLRHAMSS